MIDQIKKLADEAISVQNKALMETNLRRISALCDQAPIEAGDVLVDADGKEHKIEQVVADFCLANVKKEGCAVHPDDVDADMTAEQRAKQLDAHNKDTNQGKAAPAKKGGKK